MSGIHVRMAAVVVLALSVGPGGAVEDQERPADLQPLTPVSRVQLLNFMHFHPGGPGNAFVLSPDGKALASTSGNVISLYDLTRPQSLGQPRNIMLEGGFFYGAPLAFSADGKIVVSVPAQHQEDAAVHFIDVAAGKEIRQIDNDQPFLSVALSPDGKRLALGGQQGRVEVWDAASGDEVRILEAPANTFCQVLAFAPDGKMVAAAGTRQAGMRPGRAGRMAMMMGGGGRGMMPGQQAEQEASVCLLEVATGKVRHEFPLRMDLPATPNRGIAYVGGGPASVSALAFSRDGKLLAAGGVDQAIHLWDLVTGHELLPLAGHQAPVSALAFTPDGRRLISFDNSGLKLAWSVSRLEKPPAGKLPTLSDQDFEDLWTDLAEADPFQTYRAVRHLTADPQRALALLGRHLKPVPPGDAARLRQLVNDLRSPSAAVRRKAMGALRKEGEAALGALAQAGGPQPMPPFQAAQLVMRKLELQYATPERTRSLKAVQVLEQIGSDGARQLLSKLAGGAAGVPLTVAAKAALDELATRNNHPAGPRGEGTGLPEPERVKKDGLTAREREALWGELANSDAAKAYQALRVLRTAPEQGMALLRERLRPAAPLDAERLPRLIADLDSDRFAVRDKAMRELDDLGERAEPALRAALAGHPSPEARRRLDQLLANRQQAVLPPAALRGVRAVEALEQIGTPEARRLLQALAKGVPQAPLTRDAQDALGRLARRPGATP